MKGEHAGSRGDGDFAEINLLQRVIEIRPDEVHALPQRFGGCDQFLEMLWRIGGMPFIECRKSQPDIEWIPMPVAKIGPRLGKSVVDGTDHLDFAVKHEQLVIGGGAC